MERSGGPPSRVIREMTPAGARSRAAGVARLSTVHRAPVPEGTEPVSDMAQKQAQNPVAGGIAVSRGLALEGYYAPS